jgi:membrane protein YdbS with pleckstrin-like domain
MADGTLTGLISRFLKVPPEPDPPMGSPGSVRVFNAAPGYYQYRLLLWAVKQAGTAAGLIVGLAFVSGGVEVWSFPFSRELATLVEVVGIGLFLVQLPVSFLMVRLDYRYRWYMITDTSLRIREGLLTVRERTMTFANIQNLSLKQGPVQRAFGISDLQVRTAGGGGTESSDDSKQGTSEADNMHLGYFRGVDNASEIRDVVLARMRGLRDTGLGDPDGPWPISETERGSAEAFSEMQAAARELAAEAQQLRKLASIQ